MTRKSQRTDFPNYLIKINMLNNKTIDQVSVELFFQQRDNHWLYMVQNK